MTRDEAFAMVKEARLYAEDLREKGRLRFTSADPECPTELWLAALMEELGEVARCVHDGDGEGMAQELAQLAGVAIGRLEAM